ncbi:MAG TPA: helix-turn-helix transcriptional regulator [Candidatus Limnocylindrales bacterium]|nr:helix-turn-helix transcriptional regulator [Candidatus Limnocylindrales bacterium]
MAGRERSLDRAARRAERTLIDVGEELRQARLAAGLSQARIGAAVGVSHAHVGRVERGRAPGVPVVQLARLLAAVGLDLSVKTYPAGPPLRDVAHQALLERLRVRLRPGLHWRTEVPVAPGDQRALDALITAPGLRIGVEAEMRLRDLQAVTRRVALKRQDAGLDRMILLVAATRSNRLSLRGYEAALRADYSVSARRALQALAEGRDPGGSAIIVL